jgi:hypothetical protein
MRFEDLKKICGDEEGAKEFLIGILVRDSFKKDDYMKNLNKH